MDRGDAFAILQRERSRGSPSIQELIRYRIEAEGLANADENVYRVDWVSSRYDYDYLRNLN